MRRYHSLLIGERTAEQIKINIGAAMKDLENAPDDIPVNGRDLVTGIPKQIMVSYQEIAEALDKSIFKIEEAILKALETTPPELAADIYRRGLIPHRWWRPAPWFGQTPQPEDQITGARGRRSVKECCARNRYCTQRTMTVIRSSCVNWQTKIKTVHTCAKHFSVH